MRLAVLLLALLAAFPIPTSAQTAPEHTAIAGEVTLSGSIRARGYAWRWFGDDADGSYAYPATLLRAGVSQSRKRNDWQVELALPVVLALPGTAVKAGAPGQLGLGATYFAANDGTANAAALFLKQAAVRFNRLAGVQGQSLGLGRQEFNDGAEVAPRNGSLAALKRDRISQRLLGAFAFSDAGRSIDGAVYSLDRPALNVTAMAGRPTQGVFQANGWGELKINIAYAAATGQLGRERYAAEWRVFALGYDDYRDGVVKTDNRPLAIRSADTGSISIATYGGHYIGVAATRMGAVDVLAWGAAQTGSWGALSHRAGAFAAEVGWQPRGLEAFKPWLRGGYGYGTGDDDPTDQTHGTFFQALPTPRIYARLPFFNMMNNADAFGELILRPATRLTLRADAHALTLSNARDLWYSGGGAFQPATFGFSGRPSNGQRALAILSDASVDCRVNAHASVALYYGHAAGANVSESIYPTGNRVHFAYVETLFRF